MRLWIIHRGYLSIKVKLPRISSYIRNADMMNSLYKYIWYITVDSHRAFVTVQKTLHFQN